MEILDAIHPQFKNYMTYFEDYIEKLPNWSNIENKNYISDEFSKFASKHQSKKEKDYWNRISEISQSELQP